MLSDTVQRTDPRRCATRRNRTLAASWLALAVLASLPGAATQAQGNTAPRNVPANGATVEVVTLRPNVHAILGVGGNVVVASGPDGTLLVDSGLASSSTQLLEAVKRLAPAPVRFVLHTHGHADHTGGDAALVAQGAVVIAHESLREHAGRDVAVPDGVGETVPIAARPTVTFGEALALHLNGDRIDALHVADAHTAADVVVRWAAADIVVLGDLYWSHQYPAIDLDSGGSLAGMVAAIEGTLARTNARSVIVPGHGAPTTRAELAAWRDMLVVVGRRVREAVERGEHLEQVLAGKPTAEFDARYAPAGALVSAEAFVRSVYADLSRK